MTLFSGKSGLIRRVRGGAMLIDNRKIDVPYLMKITKLEEETEKRKIADTASSLIRDDMVLFLDSSTTSLHLVRNLARFDGLQIITNGIVTAAMLSEYTTAKVSVLGGQLFRNEQQSTVQKPITMHCHIMRI